MKIYIKVYYYNNINNFKKIFIIYLALVLYLIKVLPLIYRLFLIII